MNLDQSWLMRLANVMEYHEVEKCWNLNLIGKYDDERMMNLITYYESKKKREQAEKEQKEKDEIKKLKLKEEHKKRIAKKQSITSKEIKKQSKIGLKKVREMKKAKSKESEKILKVITSSKYVKQGVKHGHMKGSGWV